MTQRQLNKLYEGLPHDAGEGYSEIMLILAITVFYASLLPILAPISLVGIILHYWVKKYSLLRVNKIPETLGEDLAVGLTTAMPLIPLVYACGQYYFISELSAGENDI